jgi:uncharacterized protein (TIGR03435 family)
MGYGHDGTGLCEGIDRRAGVEAIWLGGGSAMNLKLCRTMPVLLCTAASLIAQSSEFDAATLKASPPPEGDLININLGRIQNGRLTLTNASLSDCLNFAYGIVADPQLAGPDWIKSKAIRFDVVAEAPPDTPRERMLLMLQGLLAERLKVAVHHESRELAYLALVQGKNGSKMRKAQPNPAPPKGPMIAGSIVTNGMSMQTLALLLSRFQREMVLDQTGLDGLFEIKLEWSPNQNTDGPALPTALQEQLGLRLESHKGPVDVLVVDSAVQIPADN